MQTLTIDWDHPTDPKPGRERDHVQDYVATGGLDGHLWHGVPTLLLTTFDRAMGRTARTPLIYSTDEGRHIVLAADWGAPQHPAWYRNLAAHPGSASRSARPSSRPRPVRPARSSGTSTGPP